MKFDTLHRFVSFLILATAMAAVFLSKEFPWTVVSVFSALAILSLFVSSKTKGLKRTLLWLLVIPAPVVLYLSIRTGNYLYYTGLYAVFATTMRGLFLETWPDFLQLYGLTFLLMVLGAVINPALSFGLLLFLYVILLVFGFVLETLRRGMEQATKREHVEDLLKRRDVITPTILGATAFATGISLAGALVLFALLPRFGYAFFNPRITAASPGVSDEVNLLSPPPLFQDKRVVLRVQGRDLKVPLRMRGQSFEYYAKGRWSHVFSFRRTRSDSRGWWWLLKPDGPEELKRARTLKVAYLLRKTTRVPVYGPPAVVAVRIISTDPFLKKEVMIDGIGDARVLSLEKTPVYGVMWIPQTPHNVAASYREWEKRYFLQVPAPLRGRLKRLALRITRNAHTPYEKALAIERYLRTHYRYTLKNPTGDTDMVLSFLFGSKSGYCEHFASAMVLLLRSIKIPSRLVTGFFGGTKNGDYIELHASDAHAWVEVKLPGQWFVTLDPTPPEVITSRTRGYSSSLISRITDQLRIWWYDWVVKYTLARQAAVFLKVLGRNPDLRLDPDFLIISYKRLFKEIRTPHLTSLVWLAIILSAMLLGWFLFVTSRKRSDILGRVDQWLKVHGHERPPFVPPMKFLQDKAPVIDEKAYNILTRLVFLGYKKRYGPGLTPKEQKTIKELFVLLKSLS